MKIPLLPELDLARIAPQPSESKRAELELFRLSRPPYSYRLFRSYLADILNAQVGFLPAGSRVPFEKIAQSIVREATSDEEAEANVRVAEGLYQHAFAKGLRVRRHELFPLRFGVAKVTYWHSLVAAEGDTPLVPFFDPRRSAKRLTEAARRFVFSVMHERIRVPDPDFAEVRLGIFQFSISEEGLRTPRVHFDKGVSLHSFDELDATISETYAIWTDVYTRRVERERKRSG